MDDTQMNLSHARFAVVCTGHRHDRETLFAFGLTTLLGSQGFPSVVLRFIVWLSANPCRPEPNQSQITMRDMEVFVEQKCEALIIVCSLYDIIPDVDKPNLMHNLQQLKLRRHQRDQFAR